MNLLSPSACPIKTLYLRVDVETELRRHHLIYFVAALAGMGMR